MFLPEEFDEAGLQKLSNPPRNDHVGALIMF
jgi:hypothetical protein